VSNFTLRGKTEEVSTQVLIRNYIIYYSNIALADNWASLPGNDYAHKFLGGKWWAVCVKAYNAGCPQLHWGIEAGGNQSTLLPLQMTPSFISVH